MLLRSLESILHIEAELADALADIVKRSVRVLLLEEQVRMHGVDHDLHRTHVQDAVVQELVQPRHVVEQEELVHVHRIPRDGQLAGPDAEGKQMANDEFLGLLDGGGAGDAAGVEP